MLWGAGGGEREETAVLDQEAVVLPDPVLEALPVQVSLPHAADEGMGVLRPPDRIGGPS